jgi:hypothetical protein
VRVRTRLSQFVIGRRCSVVREVISREVLDRLSSQTLPFSPFLSTNLPKKF